MAERCARTGTALWPHIKTHKCVAIARQQLAAGATGLTCAKLGEAEAMVAARPGRLFVAHSIVDSAAAPRIDALLEQLDELILAVTSEAHFAALTRVLPRVRHRDRIQFLLAVDTGLGREGVRTAADGARLAQAVSRAGIGRIRGLYTHEGQTYSVPSADRGKASDQVLGTLVATRDAINPKLELWPGCTVTAHHMAGRPGVTGVRPGAYVFGDLHVPGAADDAHLKSRALTILVTVVDKPEPTLALIDAGSKTFSSDKLSDGTSAIAADGRDLKVVRVNEEHGYVRGGDVTTLQIGDRLEFVPAHVCPTVNLTDRLVVVSKGQVVDSWPVEARGRVT